MVLGTAAMNTDCFRKDTLTPPSPQNVCTLALLRLGPLAGTLVDRRLRQREDLLGLLRLIDVAVAGLRNPPGSC